MRWFEHDCDALEHPKITALIKEFGHTGYMVCFGTFEKIGKYGDKKLYLSLQKYPKTQFCEKFGIKVELLESIWTSMARKNLLSSKHLQNNILYSSGLRERCDEYHKKLQRKSRQDAELIRLDKNRIDKIRIEYIKYANLDIEFFNKDDFSSTARAITILVNKAKGNDELVVEGIRWMANKGWSDWRLETLIKHWIFFLKDKKGKPQGAWGREL